ncbi:MAG: methyltransferase [Verrucomicrobia bacterium]|nr:MAG: methyltransferase [Verrucomicrobiota bacterium]
MVGWILPSSRTLVDEVVRRIDWHRARVIVEYGPGMGAFTSVLLKRMRPEAKLVAMETSEDFCHFLNSSLRDERLRVIHESAAEIDTVLPRLGYAKADYVISGIPFRPLSHRLRDAIVRKTHAVLQPQGRFLVYQFTSHALPYLRNVFGQVSRDFELLNILPAQLFCCAR